MTPSRQELKNTHVLRWKYILNYSLQCCPWNSVAEKLCSPWIPLPLTSNCLQTSGEAVQEVESSYSSGGCLRSSYPASPFELWLDFWLAGWSNIPSLSPSTLTMPSPIAISILYTHGSHLASTFSNLMLDRILSCISVGPWPFSGPPPQLPSEAGAPAQSGLRAHGAWCRWSRLGHLAELMVAEDHWVLVGVDDVSETQGVNGAVRSEWGVGRSSQRLIIFLLLAVPFLLALLFRNNVGVQAGSVTDRDLESLEARAWGPSIGNWCPWVGFWCIMFGPGYLWGLACAWTKLGPWGARFSETNPGPISWGNGPLPIIGLDGPPMNPGCMPCCCEMVGLASAAAFWVAAWSPAVAPGVKGICDKALIVPSWQLGTCCCSMQCFTRCLSTSFISCTLCLSPAAP